MTAGFPTTRALTAALGFLGANAFGAVLFFHYVENFSWVDATYFVATTLTTVGYGDINLASADHGSKLYAVYLMLSGAGTYSVLLALVVNQIVESNLQALFGRRRKVMKDHVILCGHGNLGSRINEILSELGDSVVVIEQGNNRYSEELEASASVVVHGDAKSEDALQQASIETARCIVCATSDDLANLEVAIHAREVNPTIRVVMRMYDRVLAKRVRGAFDFDQIFCQSGLAGPVFAHAARDNRVKSAIEVGGRCHLVCSLSVSESSGICGVSVAELFDTHRVSVLGVTSESGDPVPFNSAYRAALGDSLTVTLPQERLEGLFAANDDRPARIEAG
ncbi:MAG: potassium channel family protein [Myxococcota bacterium]